jgi:hypothetical protein
MSGISSKPNNNLQKYLRVSDESVYIPDSHRFVNHTEEAEKVFNYLLEEAPRNKRIMGEARKVYGIKKRNVTVLDANPIGAERRPPRRTVWRCSHRTGLSVT